MTTWIFYRDDLLVAAGTPDEVKAVVEAGDKRGKIAVYEGGVKRYERDLSLGYPDQPLVVAWLTRHEPEQAQREYFESRGLTVVQPKTFADANYSFANGIDVAKYAKDAADQVGGALHIVMGVVPIPMLKDALSALGNVPLVRADMERKVDPEDANKVSFVWLGTFTRVVRVDIIQEPFVL